MKKSTDPRKLKDIDDLCFANIYYAGEYAKTHTGHIMQTPQDNDLLLYGVSISADGERIDPKDFYKDRVEFYETVVDIFCGSMTDQCDKWEKEKTSGVFPDDLINEVPCKTHPDAPHGFLRQASHAAGRYVCECEHWEPEE